MQWSVALLVIVQTLATGLQTDPAITKYLEDIQAQYPDLDPVKTEIRPLLLETVAVLALSIIHTMLRISVLLLERVLCTRHRLPAGVIAGMPLATSDERGIEDEDDTGTLARAYKMQSQLARLPPVDSQEQEQAMPLLPLATHV